jgi:hypothetical protein
MGTIDDGKLLQIKSVLLLQVGDVYAVETITKQLLDDLVAGMETQTAENHGIPITYDDREGDLMVGFVDKLWINVEQKGSPFFRSGRPPKVKASPMRLYADVQIKRELLPADQFDFFPTVCCAEILPAKKKRIIQIRLSLVPGMPNRFIHLEPAPTGGKP